MKQLWGNHSVAWNESEIVLRNCIATQFVQEIKSAWTEINRSIHFHQIETPMIVAPSALQSHVDSHENDMIETDSSLNENQIPQGETNERR